MSQQILLTPLLLVYKYIVPKNHAEATIFAPPGNARTC